MSNLDLRIDAAVKEAEARAFEKGLADNKITVEIATEALNFIYGTEYDQSYTPIHQAIQRETLQATKLSGVIWLIDLDDFMIYLEKFRPRSEKEQGNDD